MKKAQVYAKHKYARIGPKKVAVVLDLVRGKKVFDAEKILTFDTSKAGAFVLKVLKSAVSNAKNNLGIDSSNLYVSDLYVNEAPRLKRAIFKGRTHVNPILKRNSHIVVGLSERKK